MNLDSDDEVASALAAYVLMSGEFLKRKKRKARKRRWWMGTLNKSRERYNAGDSLSDLRSQPSGRFENFCRMSNEDFEFLLGRIGPFIAKQDTNMRESIPIQERLAVTLRFFATGESYASLSSLFKFSKQTVSRCVDEVCQAIIQELQDELKLPRNENDWLNIAQEYENVWDFPNCLGAIGGRHIMIQRPTNMRMELFNYKGTFSVALLALVDARYRFTFVDIGCQNWTGSGEVLNNSSSLFSKLLEGRLKLPHDRELPSLHKTLPYVFVGDAAFPLSRHVMTPYRIIEENVCAQRIFGYRISRARQVVDNVFGLMASVFRVLRKPKILEPEKVSHLTLACVLLHNFMTRSPSSAVFYTPQGTFDTEVDGKTVPGYWRNDQSGITSFIPVTKFFGKSRDEGTRIRDSFAEYFTTSGKLPWQEKYC